MEEVFAHVAANNLTIQSVMSIFYYIAWKELTAEEKASLTSGGMLFFLALTLIRKYCTIDEEEETKRV
jgi:hypothetical protein